MKLNKYVNEGIIMDKSMKTQKGSFARAATVSRVMDEW